MIWYHHRLHICELKPVGPKSKTATARRSLVSPSKQLFLIAIIATQILHIFMLFVVS